MNIDETDPATRGWDIFNNSQHGYQIERCDETDRFTCDEEAVNHITHNSHAADACITELLNICNELDRNNQTLKEALDAIKKRVKRQATPNTEELSSQIGQLQQRLDKQEQHHEAFRLSTNESIGNLREAVANFATAMLDTVNDLDDFLN